ncbi:MAG TPA: SURF1 family protein [Sphingomicrobium sp.]|jgi:cytochrome oxidase assembly protein ShyY1|nr:SURF1 family protein [Sphingomicrobium sp.]
MIRRLPIIPTIVVLAAVAAMIGLGVWQLRRAQWKEGLLAQYAHAERLPPISWPTEPLHSSALPLFRHATGMCVRPVGQRAVAGENRAGEPGYVHVVDCSTGAEGPGMSVEVGWSKDPNAKVNWNGGLVSGIIAPDRRTQMRLVAASAPSGLQPSAEPSLASIPNNHRFYAMQWFAFAAIALIIYALAVRKRLKQEPPSP